MRNILITGGAGFIGTEVTRLAVAAGHRVTIFDNLSPQVHGKDPTFAPLAGAAFIRGDINDRAALAEAIAGVDTIVHLAAETGTGQSMYEIDHYYRVNVQGTALLFDLLVNSRHSVGNFILASSRSVYGEGAYICRTCDAGGVRRFPDARTAEQLADHKWDPPCPQCGAATAPTATREDDPTSPASIYAATKLSQEDLTRVACTSMKIAHAILRFQNVFGEGQSLTNPYTGILSIFSTRLRLGLPLPIFEDGEESRDFVHVDDVAMAVLRCIEQPSPQGILMNVGSGRPTSVLEVARLLARIMGSAIEPHVTGEYRLGDIRHNFAAIAELERVTGFVPGVSLEAGLRRFVKWVQTQPIPEDQLDRANAELRSRKLMA